jgi:hypothetical protein
MYSDKMEKELHVDDLAAVGASVHVVHEKKETSKNFLSTCTNGNQPSKRNEQSVFLQNSNWATNGKQRPLR